jgi:chromosome partitioning protein
VNFGRKDHQEWMQKIRDVAEADEVPILGEPIPLMADLARLSVVGMGLDEHPKSTAKARNLAANFAAIVNGIEHSARTPA